MFKRNSEQDKNIPLYGIADERTKAVVYRGDAYTGRFMLYAVLIDTSIRGLNLNISIVNSNWDLMLIVIIGALISTVYQIKNKVIFNSPLSRSFFFILAVVVGVSALIAFICSFIFPR